MTRCPTALAVAVSGVVLAAVGCGGPGGDRPAVTGPPDTTAPAVEARPPGGSFPEVTLVTLVADEIATIEYTLDGSTPVTGAPGTLHGTNPYFWVRMGPGTSTLRFRAVDPAGNASEVRTEVYLVDLVVPALELLSPPPGPVSIDGQATLRWRSSKPVHWTLEVGAGPAPTSWSPLESGAALAATPVEVVVPRSRLPQGASVLRVEAVDAAGHAARLDAAVTTLLPEVVFEPGTYAGAGGLVLSPDGARAFMLGAASLLAVDVDPSSPTYRTRRWSVEGLATPAGLALDPGGGRLWFGGDPGSSQVFAVNPATGTGLTSVPLPGAHPYGLAVTDGGWLWMGTSQRLLEVRDVDPASPGFGIDGGSIPSLPFSGRLLPSPDRRQLLLLPGPTDAATATVASAAPGRPLQIITAGTLGAQLASAPTAAAWAADGRSIIIACGPVDPSYALRRYDLASDTLAAAVGPPRALVDDLDFTPDGKALVLVSRVPTLELLDATTFATLGVEPLGAWLAIALDVKVTPDGAAALVLGRGPEGQDRLLRLPLR